MNILIAEDDGLEAQGLERDVRALGHQVVGTAGSGRRAVELARVHQPDLVLLDLAMPDLDGIDAARAILAARAVPIVMVTGYANPELVQRAAAAGVFTYLLKPVDRCDLEAAIQIARTRFSELQALRQQVLDLTEALEVRKVVEQAKGILMQRLGISEAEAFRRLQRRAAAERRPLRDVAEAVREADRFFQEFESDSA